MVGCTIGRNRRGSNSADRSMRSFEGDSGAERWAPSCEAAPQRRLGLMQNRWRISQSSSCRHWRTGAQCAERM